MSERDYCKHKKWRKVVINKEFVLPYVECLHCGLVMVWDEFVIWNGTNTDKMAEVI